MKLLLFSQSARACLMASGLLSVTVPFFAAASVQAQTSPAVDLPAPESGFLYNPPNRGAPGDASTADAGSRSCGLMVFEPAQSHWGETLQPWPNFWLYASNPGTVTFALAVEETAEVVYQGEFAVAEGQVMTRYSLPESAPPLVVDDAYRWRFTLDCPGDPDPAANGVIVLRPMSEALNDALTAALSDPSADVSSSDVPSDVPLDVSSSDVPSSDVPSTDVSSDVPSTEALLEQAKQLAAAGFWFDAVDALNQLRLAEVSESMPEAISTERPEEASEEISEAVSAEMTETVSTEMTEDDAAEAVFNSDSPLMQAWIDLLTQGGWVEELGAQFEIVATADFDARLQAVPAADEVDAASDSEAMPSEAMPSEAMPSEEGQLFEVER